MIAKMKKKIMALAASVLMCVNMMTLHAGATGDVATAVTNTWNSAKAQIKTITNSVIFPVLDVILVILMFVKVGSAYLDYRKHGQLEWTPIAIIFGGLLFTLTAPMYIWSVVAYGEQNFNMIL